MKKFLHLFLVLFVGISTVAFAQQEEAATIQSWDGSNEDIEMFAGDKLTFEYTATEDGLFYVYSDNQDSKDNLPLKIWGGVYENGGYDAESPLQDAGAYEDGAGVYGWLCVVTGDVVRFTIIAPEDAEGQITEFTLKSIFFSSDLGGESWNRPIELGQGEKVTLPVYANSDEEIFPDLSSVTYCSFVSPASGIASIFTEENVIYYIEKEKCGVEDFQSVVQDAKTDDHKFIVKKGQEYIVAVPNGRLAEVTFKMTKESVGASAQFPFTINSFPVTLDLNKGVSYYAFSRDLIGGTNMLEVAVSGGWRGYITYMENSTEISSELAPDTVIGKAATFVKNVDTLFLSGSEVIINFNATTNVPKEAVSLSLREPKSGESFMTAVPVVEGENIIDGPVGDYWFAYTSESDAEVCFTINNDKADTLKHINFVAGIEELIPVSNAAYRINAGETIYVCVARVAAVGQNILNITSTTIMQGDYCDNPIEFELGQDIIVECRGRNTYYSFVAENDGFAVFSYNSNKSIHFRKECGGNQLNPDKTIKEEGKVIKSSYKLPVTAGQFYIVEVEVIADNGTMEISTSFEEPAVAGETSTSAIEIKNLGETIEIPYEFGRTWWYKLVADKDGFYTIRGKLGEAGSLKTIVDDPNGTETNSGEDDYMGGYRTAKAYLETNQTLYIHIKTGRENVRDGVDQYAETYGADFYIKASFAEVRPGEMESVSIASKPYIDYSIMSSRTDNPYYQEDAYNQWYTYTIPADKEVTISIVSTAQNGHTLSFFKEDFSVLSSGNKDFKQSSITIKEGTKKITVGKTYVFSAATTDRVIYIKTPIISHASPVIWKIEGEGLSTGDDVEGDDTNEIVITEVASEAPVIYDLMGRRVENPGKGIYIVNGVKRIFK